MAFTTALRPQGDEAAIRANIDHMSKAYLAKDAKKALAFLAPDYISTGPDGSKANRAQTVKSITAFIEGSDKMSIDTSITKLTIKAPNAHADLKVTIDATFADKNGRHKYKVVVTESQNWSKRKGLWLIAAATVNHQTEWIDGKITYRK